MRLSFIILFSSLTILSLGQSQGAFDNYPDSKVLLTEQIESERYQEARMLLSNQIDSRDLSDAVVNYFEAVLNLELNGKPSHAEEYIARFTQGKEVNDLKIRLGDHYFLKRDYKNAIQWYRQSSISKQQSLKRYADALYSLNYLDSAIIVYKRLARSELKHYAHYRIGTILWRQGEKQQAFDAFRIAAADETFRTNSAYYLSVFYFENQAYDRALDQIPAKISNTAKGIELFKVKAKCLQELGRTKESLSAYQDLERAVRGRLDNEILWNYAQVAVESGLAEKAKSLLNTLIQNESEFQQEASFRLGVLQTQAGLFSDAIPSFQLAAIGTNVEIRKSSILNLAKSQMEVGLHEEAITTLTAFQAEYPNKQKKHISELLANAHFQSSDYEGTIAYIDAQEVMSPVMKQIYQLVTFENGRRYFFDQDYAKALTYLFKSNQHPVNIQILQKAQFLLAEVYSLREEYEKAIPLYIRLVNSPDQDQSILSQFGLGYAYYNAKSYDEALQAFESLNNRRETPKKLLTEADLRIGDCHFINKRYDDAIKYYRPLRKSSWGIYASYQLGLIYKFKEEPTKALAMFNAITEQDSSNFLVAEAISQRSQIFLDQLAFDESIAAANKFISSYPNHELYENTLLIKAIAATNLDLFTEAEASLNELLNTSEDKAMKKNALLALQNLKDRGHPVSNFEKFFNELADQNKEDLELINIAYESAKAPYFSQDYELAIDAFLAFKTRYQNNLPDDYFYYLGDAYLSVEKYEKAIVAFDSLLIKGAGRLQERTYNKRGEALMQIEDYQAALKNYSDWRSAGRNEREFYNSGYGMLLCYQQLEDWSSVLQLCDQLERANWRPFGSESKIALIKGEALLQKGEYTKAADEYILIMNNQEGEKAAKAYLMFASTQTLDSNYSQSNETLLQLISDFASYPTYTQEAYLQLIDNYVALENRAQATAIASSIIENGTDSLFVQKAKQKLNLILTDSPNTENDSTSNR